MGALYRKRHTSKPAVNRGWHNRKEDLLTPVRTLRTSDSGWVINPEEVMESYPPLDSCGVIRSEW